SAQTNSREKKYTNTLALGAQGLILLQNGQTSNLRSGISWGFDAAWAKNTYGYKPWQQIYGYPDAGVDISFIRWFQRPLGEAFGIQGYYMFYLRRGKKHHFFLRPSAGYALFTKTANQPDNPDNRAIGSLVNYYLQAALGYSFQITKNNRFRINPYFAASHISNGNFRKPNGPLNFLSLYANFSYRIETETPKYQKKKLERFQQGIKVNLVGTISSVRNSVNDDHNFVVLTARGYLDKRIIRISAVNLGAEFIWSEAIQNEINSNPNSNPRDNPFRVGILAGHELFIGKLSLITQLGVLIYRPFKADIDTPVYARLGFKFYLTDFFFLVINLKTLGLGESDDVGYGVGFRF
ncbi:acyloxyacyl hydrolase, partial [Xanthovirga aplysinae]|uniref:acyloxyacyl hydrolase n=1 Tax=Xanthovirga aplysinae TaxID=2529853 RepID=UPI0012BCDDEE